MREDHYQLLYQFVKWAGEQPHIEGVALIGSCADDESEEDSPLSFLIVSDRTNKTAEAIVRRFPFEPARLATKEEAGPLTSIRIEYAGGLEADYGIVDAARPLEPLHEAIADAALKGFKVLWENEELFGPIARFVARS
ncbi:hypothetical protein [Paenibacillus arenilitoris]|uniref:Uncharacterized protein n=1 Tax=Paenibacillus arenilitoris TaxID=2772299 RepID=A0A927CP53_9BACL|nr:hypothetical protein [Paenibacillus arenilitoris]MBD2871134.1 hypothetical protein [Paenibacillus arenilitoris]